MVRHKPGKEYIISNMLGRPATANRAEYNKLYLELHAFFTYHAMLVEISPNLVKRILNGYFVNNW